MDDFFINMFKKEPIYDLSCLKPKLQVKLPEKYIINKDATILFWENKEKTIVRKCEQDEFNPRLAFLTAFFQRYCGMSKNKANRYLANLQVGENKEEIKGKLVKVIDRGETYSTYPKFVEKYFTKYKDNYVNDSIPETNQKYKIIGKAKHEIFTNRTLVLIQHVNTRQVFIIGEKGIEEVK